MDVLTNSKAEAEGLLTKAKLVAKGKTLAEAGIETSWLTVYAKIARRCRDDKDFGAVRYPYEQGPTVSAFNEGFFEHREWPLRKGLEKHSSMRTVCEYEANYINAAGYWMAFHHAAWEVRQDAFDAKEADEVLKCDVSSYIAIHYGLRVVRLRSEFYKLAHRDPTHAKIVLPSLEQRYDVAAADDIVEPLEKLETHMTTQLMKAVATLSASTATRRAGKGGAAGEK